MSLIVSCCPDGDGKFIDVNSPTQIVSAVTDCMTGCDVILPSTICDELGTAKPCLVMPIPNATRLVMIKSPDVCDSDKPQTDEQSVQLNTVSYDKDDDLSSLDIAMSGDKTVSHPTLSMNKFDVMKITKSDLANEQSKDLSLTSYFDACSTGKGNFVLCDSVFYHDDHVLGHKVRQLCAPLGRRDYILKLTHDTVFGSHMAYRKVKERIRLSFWWSKLSIDAADYCISCTSCQQRMRKVASDRVPISPIPRAELPFQHITMDCIGHSDPPSSKGHKYCLCIVDSCTRWPAMYPLKSLDAREMCDAIIYLFMHTGIATVITSDNGSNFVHKLTQEFEARLRCSQGSIPQVTQRHVASVRSGHVFEICATSRDS